MDREAVAAAHRLIDDSFASLRECMCDEGRMCYLHDVMTVATFVLTLEAYAEEGSHVGPRLRN